MAIRYLPFLFIALLLLCPVTRAAPADAQVAVSVGRIGETFLVDARIDVPVAPATAWEVMTDFDHMADIVDNLKSSQVRSRAGNTWIVRQSGVARYGLLSFAFDSEREIRLEPTSRILARQLSGSAKSLESEARLMPTDAGVQIRYHATTVIDSLLAKMFGAGFLSHEVEEQFRQMTREMLRRQAGLAAPQAAR
jgi:carbon monoxide dehydrogenase subunit G